jgi:hypothetical protein
MPRRSIPPPPKWVWIGLVLIAFFIIIHVIIP